MEFQIDRNIEIKPPVLENLRRYFYLSFRYSQGSHELQEKLFVWTAHRNIYTNVPVEIPSTFLGLMKTPENHQDEELHAQRAIFRGEWDVMAKHLNKVRETQTNPNLLLQDIASSMVHRDIIFLKDKARHVSGEYNPKNPDSSSDPHASYIRRYSILQKPTGHTEFDYLFKEIQGIVTAKQFKSTIRGVDLVRLWEKKHKGHSFYLPF